VTTFDEPTWNSWSADPSVLVGLALVCFAYTYAARRAAADGDGPGPRRVAAFAGAVLTVVLALTSPLHELSERYLFTAHMAQHLMLTIVMPPLLLASLTPGMLRPVARRPWAVGLLRAATQPVRAFAGANLVFLVWHLPQLYDAALRDHNVHVASHLLFMVTALAMWWPLMSRLPEVPGLGYAGRLLFIFAQVLPGMIVGGLVANAPRPLYRLYAEAPRVSSLTAIQDQQLGALLMWVGGGTFWLVVFTVVFFAWAAPDIKRTYGAPAPPRRG
jgi:putative membrane protein